MKWPIIQEIADELRSINEEAPPEVEEGEEAGIEVRLQVLPTGQWEVFSGDPDEDPDGRKGWWGAAMVPGGDGRFGAKEVANDLLKQAQQMRADGGNYYDDIEGADEGPESSPAPPSGSLFDESADPEEDEDE